MLIDNWRRVIRRAWSIRLAILAAVLSGAEVALPLFVDAFPRNVFAVASFLVAGAAALARIVAQPGIQND